MSSSAVQRVLKLELLTNGGSAEEAEEFFAPILSEMLDDTAEINIRQEAVS